MTSITMRHPDIEGSAVTVSREAYERAYKPKGWVASESPSTALDDPDKSGHSDEPESSGRPLMTRKEK